jgi:hypothetical protein
MGREYTKEFHTATPLGTLSHARAWILFLDDVFKFTFRAQVEYCKTIYDMTWTVPAGLGIGLRMGGAGHSHTDWVA